MIKNIENNLERTSMIKYPNGQKTISIEKTI